MPTESNFGNVPLRVMRGIELLDSKKEGWRARINTKSLLTASVKSCPLAQVFGSYELGLAKLGLSNMSAKEFGFQAISSDISSYRREHAELTKHWKELASAT